MTLKSSDDRTFPDCFACCDQPSARSRHNDGYRRTLALSDIDFLRALSGLDPLVRPRVKTRVRKPVRQKRSAN